MKQKLTRIWLVCLALLCIAFFLFPLLTMFTHQMEVRKNKEEWSETVRKENIKTKKIIADFEKDVQLQKGKQK